MSGPGRPALPDPQQDRHVAFPELTPTAPNESSSTPPASPAPTGPVPGLPPDAWASHDPAAISPPSTPPWQPDPSILSTPPTRPEPSARRRRRGWLPYAAVIGFFIVMGNVNSNHDPVIDSGVGYAEQQWDGSSDGSGQLPPDPASVGWISSVADPGTVKSPLPVDSAVSPVPPGTTLLRVEAVAESPEPVTVQISNEAGLYDETPNATPVVKEVHLGSATNSLNVTVSTSAGGGPLLQCRVYAGPTLVAINTLGTGNVTCDVTW